MMTPAMMTPMTSMMGPFLLSVAAPSRLNLEVPR
jgi:hypothetical protein